MPRASITPDEQKRLSLYFDLLERYQNLDTNKMLPLIGVRMMFMRRGYDKVMGGIDRWGVDVVLSYACDELVQTAELGTSMVQRDPPPDDQREEVLRGINMTHDAASDAGTRKRIYEVLSRCHLREIWMRQKKNSAHKKPH